MSIDAQEIKQELLKLFEDKENSVRIGLVNGSPNDRQFYIDLYIFYFIFECLSLSLRVEGPYDRLTEFFGLLIKNNEIRTIHQNLTNLRVFFRNEINDTSFLSDDLTKFLDYMKKSNLCDNLYFFKNNYFYINIGANNYTELLIELYFKIHPCEENYIKNFLSTIKLELRQKTSEDDDDFGPVSNLKRKDPQILIRTDATKDIARIIQQKNNQLNGVSPAYFERYWIFLSLYYLETNVHQLEEIYFNNTILVGMSYHIISDYVNGTPLRAYNTYHIFNTELGQSGLILSPFPFIGLLTRYIKENNNNYFKEPPNLRDFLIPSLGDCFWLTESKNIKYFDLLTSTPTTGRTMYDGIQSILECNIGQTERKVDKFLPKWNIVDLNKLNKFWSNISLEFEDKNVSIKSNTLKENTVLNIDSENMLKNIEQIRKMSTIEKPLRIAQYYSWLKDLNLEIEKILINDSPQSADYIQSKYGLTPLEFKEIIVFHCSMGWFINQSLLFRSSTNSKDDLRSNAEIVCVLATLNKYRKTENDKYITYSMVLKNVKKYTRKERINKKFFLKNNDAFEYIFLMKWISKETNRFEKIQNEFNEIKKDRELYYALIPGIKASSFHNFINTIFSHAENNIQNIVYKKQDKFYRILKLILEYQIIAAIIAGLIVVFIQKLLD